MDDSQFPSSEGAGLGSPADGCSDASFDAVFASMPLGLMLLEGAGRVVRVNAVAAHLAGHEAADLPSGGVGDVLGCIHAGVDPRGCGFAVECRACLLRQGLTAALDGEARRGVDVPLELLRDGRIRPHRLRVNVEPVPVRGRRHVLLTLDDITERSQAEDALRESEQNLREAQRLSNVGSWKWTLAANTVEWSEELCRMLHHDPKLPVPAFAEMSRFYTLESWDRLNQAVTRAFDRGESYELELDEVRTDGVLLKTVTRGEVDRGPDGQVLSLFGTVQDVTRRRQVEDQLNRERSLREQTTSALLNAITESALMMSLDGEVLVINETAAARLGGAAAGDLIGRSAYDSLAPDVATRRRAAFDEVVRTGKPVRFEDVRNGRHVLNSLYPVIVDDQVAQVAVFGYDTTELAERTNALLESERWIIESQRVAKLGHYVFDIQADRWDGSGPLHEVLGTHAYDTNDFAGWLGVVHPADRERMSRYFNEEVLGKRRPFDMEYRIVRPCDGVERWVRGLGEVRFREDGKPDEMVGTIRDITERKQAEKALRESEDRFRVMFEESIAAKSMTKPGGDVHVNRALRDMLGYSEEEFADRATWQQLSHPDDVAETEWFVAELLAGRMSSARFEKRYLHRDGSIIWTDVSTSLRRDADGAPEYFMTTILDITERRRAERERQEMQAHLQETQKLESLGVLAGGIAHDFNNILTSVLGNADLALRELPPPAPARENLLEIAESAHRAADLCRQMLAFSGRGSFVIESLDLTALVEGLLNLVRSSISKKALLRLDLQRGLPPLRGDASQLGQVIINLVINASEALGEGGGVITVSTGAVECSREDLAGAWSESNLPPGLYLALEVADTGAGMDPGTQSRIFEPFFTTKFTGRGLGLAAVLGIVRGHRGALKLRSEPGRGTTFTILLPVDESASVPVGRPTGTSDEEWRGRGTVLLVDDEATIRALGARMLARLGFGVLVAADGSEALSVYRAHREEIVLVVLDLTMPYMDGQETLRELLRIDPDVRVVMSSGFTEQEITSRFAGQGLVGFVPKPYSLDVLRERLQAAL